MPVSVDKDRYFRQNAGIFLLLCRVLGLCRHELPDWLNYLVKIFSENSSVAGLSYMIIAQNAAKLTCSLVIIKIVDRYGFSLGSSSVVFRVVGAVFALGALLFLLTKEVNHPLEIPEGERRKYFRYVVDSTSYFAIGPIFTLPFAILLPLVTGKFLDHYPGLEADAYRLVCLAAAALAAAALWCILKTDFSANSANSTLSE